MHLQEAVKKETVRVSAAAGAGCIVMLAVFYILHRTGALGRVPFGAPEVVSAVIGWVVSSLNFFLMAVTVQNVAGMTDQDKAKKTMTVSYRYRMILQLGWAVLSILIPFFNPAAGIIPLFIPSIMIKIRGLASRRGKRSGGSDDQKGEVGV